MAKRKRSAPPDGRTPQQHHGAPYAIDPKEIPGVIAQLQVLGRIGATTLEIAHSFQISEPTLFAFFDRHPEARAAWEQARNGDFKISLRRKQFKLADRSAGMAIFLGKNELGQTDAHDISGTVNHNILMVQILADAEAVARERRNKLLASSGRPDDETQDAA